MPHLIHKVENRYLREWFYLFIYLFLPQIGKDPGLGEVLCSEKVEEPSLYALGVGEVIAVIPLERLDSFLF